MKGMPALQIRDFPPTLHRLLADRARLEHRTITQQATALLSEALLAAPPGARRRQVLAHLAGRRKRIDLAGMPSPEDLVRADRNR